MKDLAERLKVPLYAAIGIMETIWHYAGDYTPKGDIGRFSDKIVAQAIGWKGKPEFLIESLVSARWLDIDSEHRLIIHDWPDHAQEWVKKKMKRSRDEFLDCYRQKPETGQILSRQNSDSGQPRARLGSVNGSVCSSLEGSAEGNQQKGVLEDFGEFRLACEETGLPFSEQDLVLARIEWVRLDFEQKLCAIKGLHLRKQCGEYDDPGFRPLPQNYLSKGMWQRPLRIKQTFENAREKMWKEIAQG